MKYPIDSCETYGLAQKYEKVERNAVFGTIIYKLLKYLDKKVLICTPGFLY